MNSILATTERLVLRPWRPVDADVLLRMRARPEVARWMAETAPWARMAQAEEAIARWTEALAVGAGLGTWAITPRDGDTPIGSVSLKPIPNGDGEVEIGWMLDPDVWGRGYAREAAAAVLAHGRSLALPRIWALMWPGNDSSAKVCRAIGMDDLGVRPDPWYGGTSHMFRVGGDGSAACSRDHARGLPG